MIVKTEFSAYEIDLVNKQVRRLSGVNSPTARQGEDGEWRHYYNIDLVDNTLMFIWDDQGRATQTSNITFVGEQ